MAGRALGAQQLGQYGATSDLVVTPGLCRCGFVSDTEGSGDSDCPHSFHETAVTANGGWGK